MQENNIPKGPVLSLHDTPKDLFFYVVTNLCFINAYYSLNLLTLGQHKYCYFQPSSRDNCCYAVIDNESDRDVSPYINKYDQDCSENIEEYCENLTKVIAHMCEIATKK